MKYLSVGLAALCFATPFASSQQTSENNARLKDGLVKFPEADADKNGVLTVEEARAFLKKRQSTGKRPIPKQNPMLFKPTEEDLATAINFGTANNNMGPLQIKKGNGLRVVMTGHSWVAPGRNTLLRIATGAGLDGHRQRHHTGGGPTGSANAIWLKEFGKWKEGEPPKPILIPAIVTGQWDVMTWGSYYEDKPEYYHQWIDLCLKHNPGMTFCIQDGWPRFLPEYKTREPAEILEKMTAQWKEFQNEMYRPGFEALDEKYPGKIRIIPASYAVVDLIGQFYEGKLPHLDCVDEKTNGGKNGIYRDGGHLSKTSGIEHLVGYLYYGMLYGKSPALIETYIPANIPLAFDRKMRVAAWKAIVTSPFAGVDDEDGDGIADVDSAAE